MKKYSAGFTLIELLVVIAVIGILASVALYSAQSARNKGIDSTIKADMRTISQQVELQFLNVFAGNYGTPHPIGPCTPATAGSVFADAKIQQSAAAIQKLAGAIPRCASTTTQWAVSVPLRGGNYWCIETEGKAKVEPAQITGTFCP